MQTHYLLMKSLMGTADTQVGRLSFNRLSMTSTIDGDWVEISVEPVEKVSFLVKK